MAIGQADIRTTEISLRVDPSEKREGEAISKLTGDRIDHSKMGSSSPEA